MKRWLITVGLLCFAVASCGRPHERNLREELTPTTAPESSPQVSSSPSQTPEAVPEVPGPTVAGDLWQTPINDQIVIESPTDAGLAFEPHVPAHLGSADTLVATDPAQVDAPRREIAWVYDHQSYGHVTILEELADGTMDGLLSEGEMTAGCNSTPGQNGGTGTVCSDTTSSEITLSSGQHALLLTGGSVTSVTWLEPISSSVEGFQRPAVEVIVYGLSGDLTAENAIAAANDV